MNNKLVVKALKKIVRASQPASKLIFNDERKFDSKVGLISDDDFLDEVGAPEGHDCGRYEDFDLLPELKEFCKKNPKWHIVTHTSDGDNLKEGGITFENSVHTINRMAYYLANKDANPNISLKIDFSNHNYKTVKASEKKTFADHLFGEIEDAKKEVSEIETKVRSELKNKPEIDILQEIAFQIMKKDNKIPNWIKTKAMEVYDKMIKNS